MQQLAERQAVVVAAERPVNFIRTSMSRCDRAHPLGRPKVFFPSCLFAVRAIRPQPREDCMSSALDQEFSSLRGIFDDPTCSEADRAAAAWRID